MARTWLSIAVELLGGRDEIMWPRPGRIFAVGPSHTFAHLGDAINVAFARWDLAHLSEFSLANGTVITDLEFSEGPQSRSAARSPCHLRSQRPKSPVPYDPETNFDISSTSVTDGFTAAL